MRKLALLLALTLAPAHAWALNTDQLLSTIAMPLAVAAVSNASGVDQSQLANLVASLNQANVPPQQFVEVIRYVPVVMLDQNGQPFVAYVQEQTSQGVTGNALVDAIVNRLQSNYNVTPVMTLNQEPTTFVLSDNYIPPYTTSPYTTASLTNDPLSLIALPLAVAAVSDISGVPQDQLANLVTTLDNANVPPIQEIQIIRYAPVALVDQNGQPFIAYVQQQVAQGVIGPALVPAVVQQLQTYYPAQTQITVAAPPPVAPTSVAVAPAPQPAFVEREFAPPPVAISRVQEFRAHPHGGPPGQLKKELGLQTGAEVVHGEKRGRQFTPVAAAPAPAAPVVMVPQGREGEGHGRGHERPAPMISSAPPPARAVVHQPGPPAGGPPGHAKDNDGGKGKDGKGHGHGKD